MKTKYEPFKLKKQKFVKLNFTKRKIYGQLIKIMANYFNPKHDFNVSWTISDLQIILDECKSETKLVQKELKDTITPMVKKVAAIEVYDVVHSDSEKFQNSIDLLEELKLKCNEVSQLIASIHSKKDTLKHGLCEIKKSQKESN